jgi:hypothetical protein
MSDGFLKSKASIKDWAGEGSFAIGGESCN